MWALIIKSLHPALIIKANIPDSPEETLSLMPAPFMLSALASLFPFRFLELLHGCPSQDYSSSCPVPLEGWDTLPSTPPFKCHFFIVASLLPPIKIRSPVIIRRARWGFYFSRSSSSIMLLIVCWMSILPTKLKGFCEQEPYFSQLLYSNAL